ncbi:MAG TPA: hypothetical protein VJ302_22100 [Blastocatellia bacterium]|nr:hypothetical protein [Blastocatellia bacterium]
MSTPLTKTQIWGAPIMLGALSAVGLMAALLADGLWDAVSWAALAAPVLVCLRCIWRKQSPEP